MDYGRYRDADLAILADTALAIPLLTERCAERRQRLRAPREGRSAARARLSARATRRLAQRWQEEARAGLGRQPDDDRRAWRCEIWDAIKDEDWVLTANTLEEWARKLWDFDKPYRHPGKSLGTATQIGISLGVALAHKGTGRLVVDIQPDGDLMFDAGALWVAAKHQIPMLVVMYNNRAYYNDWEHQIRMARLRGTPRRARLHRHGHASSPIAGLRRRWRARWAGTPRGRSRTRARSRAALQRAIAKVKAGQPALLDTVTRFR